MIVGIDASNIRSGGGTNHLVNLLRHTTPGRVGLQKVIVWSGFDLADQLPTRNWIEVRTVKALEHKLPKRISWQQTRFPAVLRRAGVDVLLSPGGTVPFNSSIPCVVMFRNSLPFEKRELRRYPVPTSFRLRLELLRLVQTVSMRRADGLICLSNYSLSLVRRIVGRTRTVVIPHGIEERFFAPPRRQLPLECYSEQEPFRLLYVSPVWSYKHQWNIAVAVNRLRLAGMPVTVDFVGAAAEPRAVRRLRSTLEGLSEGPAAARFLGSVVFDDLHRWYLNADGFVFASSCENLPNTLLEAMASGLPIAASAHPPMPEVLGDGGLYFDPESVSDSERTLSALLEDAELRECLSHRAFSLAQDNRWEATAHATWLFVAETLATTRQERR